MSLDLVSSCRGRYAECHLASVVMLNVIRLSVVMQGVIMLNVIRLSVVMLNVIRLSAVVQGVVASCQLGFSPSS